MIIEYDIVLFLILLVLMSIERRADLKPNPISFPEILRHKKDRFLEDKAKLENLMVRKKVKSLHRANASQLSSGRRVKTEINQFENNILSRNLSVAVRVVGSHSIWSDPTHQQSEQAAFALGIGQTDSPEKKAKNLIKRLRKLREYNQGRFFIARKKQEQQKQLSKQKRQRQKQERLKKYKLYKQEQSRKNIILHQSRIQQRQMQIEKRAIKQAQSHSVLLPPFDSQQLSLFELQKRLQRISIKLNKRFP